jgi:hypothetical protein
VSRKSMIFSYKFFHVAKMPTIPRMVKTYDPIR